MSYKSGETVYGAATIRSGWVIANDAYVDEPDCMTYNVNGRGGKLYDTDVLSGGVLNNIVVANYTGWGSTGYLENIRIGNGGTVIVRSAGNSGADITVGNGGILHVQTLGTVTNVEVLDGGSLYCTNNGQAGCYVSGLTVRAGGTAQFTTTAQSCNIADITVEAGGTLTITTSFVLSGDINFAVGTLTNDDDAYAENGTIYDLNLGITGTFGSGVTVSRFSKSAGTTVIGAGATVDTAELKGGTLYLSAGATGRNITQNAGTLTIEAGANIDGVTYNGGTFGIASGVTVSNFNKNGTAAISMNAGAVVDGGVMTAGTLQALNTGAATVRNYTMRGTAATYIILRGAGLLAENVAVSGGSLCIQANASANNIDVYAGGQINTPGHQPGATYTNLTLHTGATGLLTTVNVGGLVMESDTQLSINATKISAATIDGGELTVAGNNYISGGATINNLTVSGTGNLFLNDPYTAAGGAAYAPIRTSNLTVAAGLYVLMHGTNVTADNATVQGSMYVQNGAVATGGEIQAGGFVNMWARANYNDSGVRAKTVGMTIRSGGTAAANGADFVDMTTEAGALLALNNNAAFGGSMNTIAAGTIIMNDVIDADAHTDENHVLRDLDVSASVLIVNSDISLADLTVDGTGKVYARNATITGLAQNGGETHVSNGAVVEDAAVAGGSLWISGGATGNDIVQTGGYIYARASDAQVSGVTLRGGNMSVGNGGSIKDADISGGTVYVRHFSWGANTDVHSGVASDVRVYKGGCLQLESGGILQAGKLASGCDLTIYKGAQAALTSAEAGAEVYISFWDVNEGHGNTEAVITDWGEFDADAKVYLYSMETDYNYRIAETANSAVTLTVANTAWGLYGNAELKAGDIYANAFTGKNYDFSDGTTVAVVAAVEPMVQEAAETFNTATATELLDGGLAAKWDSDTTFSGSVTLAEASLGGNVWLEIDGADVSSALYGAAGDYGYTVNLYAKSGTIHNLAAGAAAGGSVAGVNLTVEGADFTGVAYAGGFGTVEGKAATLISDGTFAKDFYAGALANKLNVATQVGEVALTVDGGEFSGNIYGASAVKTVDGTGSGVRHTAGDVTLTITGGEAENAKFCAFAGGYATGTASGTVYTVENIAVEVSGGSWGEANGGRGIFGGVMASGVGAEAGDVSITIADDATMGNVYGGGWAQKNGTSTVGDVNISIAGGTVANVFGGGSHSTSGGATEAGDVTITVSGGNITNAIYARGQLDGDSVTSAEVIFTGSDGYDCVVFGYSYVGGTASDATLSFTGYTGEFSGAIGGFDGITLDGATAMTLDTEAENVSNTAWTFDVSERDAALADTALLDWFSADFAAGTVTLNLAAGSTAEWSLVDASAETAYHQFDVQVGGISILDAPIGLDDQIAAGDYAGWGFTLDNSVLKFKNLA